MDYPTAEVLDAALPDDIVVERTLYDEGGQRAVYVARKGGTHCVLKLMPEIGRARADREIAIGHTFDHPNLARILDDQLTDIEVGDETFVYFTETLIEGTQLAARDSVLDPCGAMQLADNLISAVTYLWEQHHVVHRDIKPLNIIDRGNDTYVLLDIGVARHKDKSTLTKLGGPHQPGTEGYLAPEQLAPLKGREIDFRADLFAIGIVVFEAVTGRLPFDPDADSYRTLLSTGVLKDIEELPEPLAAFLGRLLAPQPHNRYRLDKAAAAVASTKEALGCS